MTTSYTADDGPLSDAQLAQIRQQVPQGTKRSVRSSLPGLGLPINEPPSPESLVQRQLDAYNARDIDALLATYAEDAQQFEHPGKLVATGHAQIRERMLVRFREPNLFAKLLQRAVMGDVVIDHEDVTRTLTSGPAQVELVAIYEVREGKIRTASVCVQATTMSA